MTYESSELHLEVLLSMKEFGIRVFVYRLQNLFHFEVLGYLRYILGRIGISRNTWENSCIWFCHITITVHNLSIGPLLNYFRLDIDFKLSTSDVFARVTHRRLIFMQHLIVFGHRHAEDDCGHVLEAVYPLFTLASLTTHVEQSGQKRKWNVISRAYNFLTFDLYFAFV